MRKRTLVVLSGGFMVANVIWFMSLDKAVPLEQRLPPPGRMIDLGGYRLHMQCAGTGTPTVILEAGALNWSSIWALVQEPLSQTTRVCSYDRAGLGWSDPGPTPRDGNRTAGELRSLLMNSGERGPFIVVGWSRGGTIAWLFAQQNPEMVAGLISVDSPAPSFIGWLHTLPEAERIRMLLLASYVGYSQRDSDFFGADFPESARSSFLDREFNARMRPTAMAETITDEEYASMSHLGRIPLTVIEAGKTDFPPKQWHEGQMELLDMSDASRYILAEDYSHGSIGTRGAGIIVQAVEDMIDDIGR